MGNSQFALAGGMPLSHRERRCGFVAHDAPGNTARWTDFQVNPPASKTGPGICGLDRMQERIKDVPNAVIAAMPPTIAAGLDAGVSLFACSVGRRRWNSSGKQLPSNFWDSSLIFLVDPSTGANRYASESRLDQRILPDRRHWKSW